MLAPWVVTCILFLSLGCVKRASILYAGSHGCPSHVVAMSSLAVPGTVGPQEVQGGRALAHLDRLWSLPRIGPRRRTGPELGMCGRWKSLKHHAAAPYQMWRLFNGYFRDLGRNHKNNVLFSLVGDSALFVLQDGHVMTSERATESAQCYHFLSCTTKPRLCYIMLLS